MYRLYVQVTAYGRQTVPDRAWSGHVIIWPITNFWGFNHITGAEPKVVRCCTQVGYINSRNRMTYHSQKGRGYGHVAVLKLCHLSWCSASHRFVSDSWATCSVGSHGWYKVDIGVRFFALDLKIFLGKLQGHSSRASYLFAHMMLC